MALSVVDEANRGTAHAEPPSDLPLRRCAFESRYLTNLAGIESFADRLTQPSTISMSMVVTAAEVFEVLK